MRKCCWFGSPAILLSGISNLLSAYLDKNVILNTLNQLWLKFYQTTWAVLMLFINFNCIFSFVFIFSHFLQAFIISLIVNVWLLIHLSELWKLSIKGVYCYIFHEYIPSIFNYIRFLVLLHALWITPNIRIPTPVFESIFFVMTAIIFSGRSHV